MKPAREAPIRILIVDDHPMVREGLRSMLTAAGLVVVAEAGSGREALDRLTEIEVDVVLLDLRLPDMSGLAVLRSLRDQGASVRVVVVTMVDDPWLRRDAVALGALGYVQKDIDRASLLATIQTVARGSAVVDPVLLRPAMDDRSIRRLTPVSSPDALTAAEIELLHGLARGLTNREIADQMHWSVGTVKKYVQRLLEKLQVSDRTEAAAVAVRRGLVD